MPDEDGRLTIEERTAIKDFVVAKGADRFCAACGKRRWEVAEHLVNISAFSVGGVLGAGASYPAALLICVECGFMRMHSAVKTGTVKATVVNERGNPSHGV